MICIACIYAIVVFDPVGHKQGCSSPATVVFDRAIQDCIRDVTTRMSRDSLESEPR
jgi:hypothetical protein